MDCEDTEETISKLSDWFTGVCKFQSPLAIQLASELVNNCGITGYEQFPVLQQADPNWLNSLECSIPSLAKILVKVNVEKIGRTPLRSLDLEDVRGILEACYAEFPYGQIFKEKQISGFNLSYVEKVEELKAFGITNDIHAMTLFASVTEWKRVGVPNELIDSNTLRNIHIKEEAIREVSRAKNATRSAPCAPLASMTPQQNPLVESAQNETRLNRDEVSDNQVEIETLSSGGNRTLSNPAVAISTPSVPSASASAESVLEIDELDLAAATRTQQALSTQPRTGYMHANAQDAMEESEIPDANSNSAENSYSLSAAESDCVVEDSYAPSDSAPITSTELDPSGLSSLPLPSTGSSLSNTSIPTSALLAWSAEPKSRAQHRSISEAKQKPAKQKPVKPIKDSERPKPTSSKAVPRPTNANTPMTYGQYYNGRHFPGIPRHTGLQARYAQIVQKMRNTKVNAAVVVNEQEADMLRAVPESLVGGKWIAKSTDNTLAHAGNQSNDASLVFVSSAQLAAEGATNSVQSSKASRVNPAADFMILVVEISSVARKQPAVENGPNHSSTIQVSPDAASAAVIISTGNEDPQAGDFGDYDHNDADGGVSSPSSDSESSQVTGRPTANTNKRSRSPGSQSDEEDSQLQLQRPKRAAAGTSGAVVDVEENDTLPRRSTRSISSASSTGPASRTRRHSSAHETSSRKLASPSGSRASGLSSTRKIAGRHSLGASTSGTGGERKGSTRSVSSACHDIMHSRDNQDLINGVNFLGTATSKNGREAVDHIVQSGTYHRLLHFIHLAPQLPSTFVYYVLRTVSLIVTRLDGLAEIELIFENNRFKDIMQLCTSDNDFVREQSLHLVSEIGVGEENGLKQRVLDAGAVQAIIDCYNNVECFSNPKTAARIQGQCARSLYKLASLSTPKQFPVFVPALRMLHDVLLSTTCGWMFVVEAAQAVSFLVMPDQPRQIEVLMEHDLLEVLVGIFQDNTRNSGLRWHASIFVWSVAKYCSNAQMRKLFRLMGILGNVCHTDDAHPHLRAAALNIMQVMLQRGDFIIQQFVYHRDKIPTIVMDLLRAHKYKMLVHEDGRNSNCIIKYAAFTLAHAVIGANKDQLLKLLDLGAYPLLFKIISLEGEDERLEEVKLLGVSALIHILQEAPSEIRVIHDREAHKRANPTAAADAWWAVVRGLVEDTVQDDDDLSVVHDPANSAPEASRSGSPSAGTGASAGAGVSTAEASRTSDQLDVRRASTGPKDFLWSEELREKAQEVIDMAHEVGLL